MIDLSLVNWDYVISIVISFAVAATFMTLYNKRRLSHTEELDNNNETMIEVVISEYSRRLKYVEEMVVELRALVDNLETRQSYPYSSSKKTSDTDPESHTEKIMSQQESQKQPKRYITPIPIKQASSAIQPLSSVIEKSTIQDIQNSTIDYVLKLLNERPRTSREIQSSIGRTREHTSRLMKRLYESHMVDRQSNSRPYKYTIAEAGHIKINVQPKKGGGFGKQKTSHDVIDIHPQLQHNNPEYQ